MKVLLAAGLGFRGPIGGTERMALDAIAFSLERGARLDVRNREGRTARESVLRAKEHSAAIEAFLRGRSPVPTPAP